MTCRWLLSYESISRRRDQGGSRSRRTGPRELRPAGRSKSMSKKLTISSWSLMFALITDYQGTRAPINILKAEFDNLRASQLQIPHKPKNGEVRKGTAVRFDLSKGGGTIPLP